MSEIYGFEFKYTDFTTRTYNRYIILEKRNNTCCLQCFENGSVYLVDISNKVDELCDRFIKMDINSWNMKSFDGQIEFFPVFDWSLYIEADDIFVSCNGMHNYPPNWEIFKSIMDEIGVSVFLLW